MTWAVTKSARQTVGNLAIKSPIIRQEALLGQALTTTTASTQSHIYKTLTLSTEGTYTFTL